MEYKYEKQIKCPYCGWEDRDSWEFTEDSGTHSCENCEREFNVERDIEVTYSTSKINCEETDEKHDYKDDGVFIGKRDYSNGVWADLPEKDWKYTKIVKCDKCDDKEYVDITKAEYESAVAKV